MAPYGFVYDTPQPCPNRKHYVVEHLLEGWTCPTCKIWNGDAKDFLIACRNCSAPRPTTV